MKTKKQLLEHLKQNTLLNKYELEKVCSCFELVNLKSNDYFQYIDTPVYRMGYIVDGIVRVYKIDSEGCDFIKYFVTRDHFISDLDGFIYKKPAGNYIQAVNKCKLLIIHFHDLEKLKNEIPCLELSIHQLLEKSLIYIIENQCIRDESNPYHRYKLFHSNYPEIARTIQLKYMAAYLRISKASLCRIRQKATNSISRITDSN